MERLVYVRLWRISNRKLSASGGLECTSLLALLKAAAELPHSTLFCLSSKPIAQDKSIMSIIFLF
jgi:hypothetical protein